MVELVFTSVCKAECDLKKPTQGSGWSFWFKQHTWYYNYAGQNGAWYMHGHWYVVDVVFPREPVLAHVPHVLLYNGGAYAYKPLYQFHHDAWSESPTVDMPSCILLPDHPGDTIYRD